MKKRIVLNQVATSSVNAGALTLGGFGAGTNPAPTSVEWDDGKYIVGEHVRHWATPEHTYNWRQLIEGGRMMAMVYASLEGIAGEINLVYGLPVEMMKLENAQEIRSEIGRRLSGKHSFSVNGTPHDVHVEHVFTMAQPLGGYWSWLLNNKGKIRQADWKGETAIFDLGMNTLDLLIVENGVIQHRRTKGDTGIRSAIERLQEMLHTQYDIECDIQETAAWLQGNGADAYASGKKIDIADMAQDVLTDTAIEIMDFTQKHWGNGKRFANFLAMGHGPLLIKDALFRTYPFAQLVHDPGFAIALGLAQFGMRKWTSRVVGIDPGFWGFKSVSLG